MAKQKENYNDKLKKWIDFDFKLDTSSMRDLEKEEEESCSKALINMSEETDIILFKDK